MCTLNLMILSCPCHAWLIVEQAQFHQVPQGLLEETLLLLEEKKNGEKNDGG